jgi:hypothetical protein
MSQVDPQRKLMTLDVYRRTNGKCRGQVLISINDSLDQVMSGCVN